MDHGSNNLIYNGSPNSTVLLGAAKKEGGDDAVTGLFDGDVAQVRVWSSPCPDPSLQRLVGRSGVFEADATLVCLWKVDEGIGSMLRNSRPLQPPMAPRGSKAGASGNSAGAEGHAELQGRWTWVSCFDPDDYDASSAPPSVPAGYGVSSAGESAEATATAAAQGEGTDRSPGHLEPESPHGGSLASAVEFSPSPLASSPTLAVPAGGVVDFARSLGWRSVSTAGDEEEEYEAYGSASSSMVGDRGTSAPEPDSEGRGVKAPLLPPPPSTTPAASAGRAGASAALSACAVMAAPAKSEVPVKEALLGILGKLFQQCSAYLEPCQGDPQMESQPVPRGGHLEARVQLQMIRREEKALKTIVQPEVCPIGWR